MKKILFLIIVFAFPFVIFAKEIDIQDINIKLSVNDDYIVLTRDNLENNSDLKKLGISENYMKNTMENNNIYVDVLAKDISYEILIVVPKVTLTFNDLSEASDIMLDNLKGELVKKTGAEVSSVYKGKHNYIMVDYYDKNTEYYIVNYYTIVNSKGYNIQLQKKTEIENDEKEALRSVVDTISIDEVKSSDNKTGSNKNVFNSNNIIIGMIIGIVFGIVSYIISIIIKKKSTSSKNDGVDKKKKLTTDEDNK